MFKNELLEAANKRIDNTAERLVSITIAVLGSIVIGFSIIGYFA